MLWAGFGEALGSCGDASEASGEPLERFVEALGRLWRGFGEALGKLWGAVGEPLGRLWGSFGSLSEPFFSSRLLFLPYIKKNTNTNSGSTALAAPFYRNVVIIAI